MKSIIFLMTNVFLTWLYLIHHLRFRAEISQRSYEIQAWSNIYGSCLRFTPRCFYFPISMGNRLQTHPQVNVSTKRAFGFQCFVTIVVGVLEPRAFQHKVLRVTLTTVTIQCSVLILFTLYSCNMKHIQNRTLTWAFYCQFTNLKRQEYLVSWNYLRAIAELYYAIRWESVLHYIPYRLQHV